MNESETAKRNHERNKSDIVNTVKEMFRMKKWGDEEYEKRLADLVHKDEELVKEVINKIKMEKGFQ